MDFVQSDLIGIEQALVVDPVFVAAEILAFLRDAPDVPDVPDVDAYGAR